MLIIMKGVISKLQGDIVALREDHAATIDTLTAEKETAVTAANARADELNEEVTAAQHETATVRRELDQANDKIKNYHTRVSTLEEDNRTLDIDKRKLEKDLDDIKRAKSTIDQQLLASKATVEQMSGEKKALTSQRDTIEQQRDAVQKRFDDSLVKSGKLQHQLDEKIKACSDGEQELANIKKSRKVTGVERDKARKEVAELKQSLADANQNSEERLAQAGQTYKKVYAAAMEMLVASNLNKLRARRKTERILSKLVPKMVQLEREKQEWQHSKLVMRRALGLDHGELSHSVEQNHKPSLLPPTPDPDETVKQAASTLRDTVQTVRVAPATLTSSNEARGCASAGPTTPQHKINFALPDKDRVPATTPPNPSPLSDPDEVELDSETGAPNGKTKLPSSGTAGTKRKHGSDEADNHTFEHDDPRIPKAPKAMQQSPSHARGSASVHAPGADMRPRRMGYDSYRPDHNDIRLPGNKPASPDTCQRQKPRPLPPPCISPLSTVSPPPPSQLQKSTDPRRYSRS